MPAASGYFRTSYARDLALVDTRAQKAALAAFALVALAVPALDAPFLLDLANQVLLATIGAVALMLLAGFTGQVSLGHAGLLAAGAFTVGILFKEVGAPFWVTLPAAAAVGAAIGLVFGLPSPAPARPVSRGVDARAALHRHLPRCRVRDAARALHRRRHRPAAARRVDADGRSRLVLRAPRLRRGRGARRPQPGALADRARLARDPGPRGGRRGARHQRAPRTRCSRSW